jgi:hypothetical protein
MNPLNTQLEAALLEAMHTGDWEAKDSGSMLNIGTINAAENATVNITLNSTEANAVQKDEADKNKIVPVP